jgi:thioesterase domain-containing protein
VEQFDLFGLHSSIQLRFTPRPRPWPGRAVIFSSEDHDRGAEADLEVVWGDLLPGLAATVPIPGDHLGMLRRPHAAILAAALRDQISQALPAPAGRPELALPPAC